MLEMHALLRLMADRGASDLFLSCGTPPHIKIEGTTHFVNAPALVSGDAQRLAYSVMTEHQRVEFEQSKESNLALTLDGVGRYRINVYYQRGEVALVARLIKPDAPTPAQLGMPAVCVDLAMLKRGLVLLVGAAGSGKSTSLAAMIRHRSETTDGHILTIEDPIEILIPHRRSVVDQREVSIDTRSFGDALRNAMREAPDVIAIGEIRDEETARHAIAYAETGHLCLSTLHANNATQAIERILNFFPESAQRQLKMDLSLNLQGVISQRLIPAVDGKLALATEVLLMTPYVVDLIHKGRMDEIKDVMAKGNEIGMHTFDQSLFRLYQAGRLDRETALRHADSHTDLALSIRLAGGSLGESAAPLSVEKDSRVFHSRK